MLQSNGVRARTDGEGDPWSEMHRYANREWYMQDVDAMFGGLAFGKNTAEKLFLEYTPDVFSNRFNAIREFAFVGMFDRKRTEATAFSTGNLLSSQFYCWCCRRLSEGQPAPGRFFYVIGSDTPPWRMIEIDIQTGERTGSTYTVANEKDFRTVWAALGLCELREQLKLWVESKVSRQQ